MRLADRAPSSFLFAWITSSLMIAGTAVCQIPDTARRAPATVIGQVVDTTGAGISGAEVTMFAGDTPVVAPTMSDSQGNFRFRNLPAGSYAFIARKMGYKPARGRGITVAAGDTLRLRFVLNPLVVVLAPVTVKGRRRDHYGFYAEEFAAKMKGYRDLLDLLAWRRPDMFGDPYFCSKPDSFGNPIQDEVRIKVTRGLILGSGGGGHRPRPWLDSMRFSAFPEEVALPYVRQVYVNGMRVDRPGDPIRTPARMLRAIPMQHVAEMHYIDCWDRSLPIGMQYSIVVTLKPLPPAQADSVFRFILAQAAPTGPLAGRVMSVKHPSRQQWDSIVRLLTGRDSAATDSASAAASP